MQVERPGKIWFCADSKCVTPKSLQYRGVNNPKAPAGSQTWYVKVGSRTSEAEIRLLGASGIRLKVETHMVPANIANAANTAGSDAVESTRFGRKVQRKTTVSKAAFAMYAKFMQT